VGLSITSIAFFMFALVPVTGASTIILALALLGLGNGLFISPNVASVMGSVPANRRGIASGLRVTLFNVGDSAGFGLAVLIMTLVIPYNTLNILVQNYSVTGQAVGKQEFILGFQLVAIALATINTFAIIPASWTGRKPASRSRDVEIIEDEK
jgi:MFS family permease